MAKALPAFPSYLCGNVCTVSSVSLFFTLWRFYKIYQHHEWKSDALSFASVNGCQVPFSVGFTGQWMKEFFENLEGIQGRACYSKRAQIWPSYAFSLYSFPHSYSWLLPNLLVFTYATWARLSSIHTNSPHQCQANAPGLPANEIPVQKPSLTITFYSLYLLIRY